MMSKVTLVSLDSFRDSMAYRTSMWVLELQLDHLGMHPCDWLIARTQPLCLYFPICTMGAVSHYTVRMTQWVNSEKPLEQCRVRSNCFLDMC